MSSLDPRQRKALELLIQEQLNEAARQGTLVQQTTTLTTSSYEGPLPPAEETRRYEEIFPGFTDRWIAMSEKGQEAEIKTVERRDRGHLIYKISSLVATFLLCAAMIVGGIWLLGQGRSGAGFTTLGTAVAAILAAGFSTRPSAQSSRRGR